MLVFKFIVVCFSDAYQFCLTDIRVEGSCAAASRIPGIQKAAAEPEQGKLTWVPESADHSLLD